MIIHVFTGDRTHLVPTILRGFLKLEINQFYIVFCSEKNVMLYNELFKEYKIVDYVLVSSWDNFKKKADNSKIKEAKIILHGVPYSWMWRFIIAYKDVNWICWGAGARINYSNWKSVIFTPIKRWIYKRFCNVGVLMPQDEASLKSDYGVREVSLLSYFGSIDEFPFDESNLNCIIKDTSSTRRIYLGNNPSSIDSYIKILPILPKFSVNFTITCMLNYSFKETQQSKKLECIGNELFLDNFKMDKTLYSLKDYFNYMNECDVYICGVKKQTGLGAIFTCLRLGKKIYLDGINFEWISSLGCKVFHVSEINHVEEEEFFAPICYDDQLMNFRIITSYLNRERIIGQWLNFMDIKK